jgi:hypothetical protein
MSQIAETSDAYPAIMHSSCGNIRVIVCNERMQWIAQRRKKSSTEARPWRAFGYVRSTLGLRRLLDKFDDKALMLAINVLPQHFSQYLALLPL